MARAGIALGSNLGDRLAQLRAAVTGLSGLSTPGQPILTAQIYRTEPRDCPPGSPDFFNTVIEIEFRGNAHELLEKTRALELQFGRCKDAARHAPRLIDIDLLYLGNACCNTESLILPHPRIAERRFVLQPLADIRPDLILPGQSLTVTRLLETLHLDERLPALVSAEL
jgi:2-amino-4-hydroxy-6-hydroxymethyldihydropteridine diphosphokinase